MRLISRKGELRREGQFIDIICKLISILHHIYVCVCIYIYIYICMITTVCCYNIIVLARAADLKKKELAG